MSTIESIRKKIHTQESFTRPLETLRYFANKIVFTNGCFDLLHPGHVDYLAKAKDFGDFLVVGLNSDASVRSLNKGETRPLQDQDSRSLILASLVCVDAVILFNEETPYELIKFIQPDVLVKGADYRVEQIAGHDIVLTKGGEVMLIDLVPGHSTSAIERKIRGEK
ncbi:MAG TPA: D-glycero-beta-D-manno-heptose 1-phosphate adenylyltransferase [Bacteroidia bacterium]|nr:D-glycero-beta-D-manno-heptose 1-phosphate adenylyltransferase [Bacteroidia bacterium]